jgi:small-conductance mechanosensitive channel
LLKAPPSIEHGGLGLVCQPGGSRVKDWITLVGPRQSLQIFGIRLVGVNAETGKKLLFTLVLLLLVVGTARLLRGQLLPRLRRRQSKKAEFWAHQLIRLGSTVILLLGLASVWFDEPGRLTTALGLVTAGLAFALQKVVTAIAGYFVILRGNIFHVGDRIVMGGVRGDVIALDLTQTRIMEMGQPPNVQNADPAMWLKSREYTGRVVMVTNARIFEEPVFNYTREFPYIWEELSLPVSYASDRARAEQILLSAATRHTVPIAELSEPALREMERRYLLKAADLSPHVYYRLTDNWLELTVRFIVEDHGIRAVKDAMARDVLLELDAAGIGIASATFEIVGVPPLRLESAARTRSERSG